MDNLTYKMTIRKTQLESNEAFAAAKATKDAKKDFGKDEKGSQEEESEE